MNNKHKTFLSATARAQLAQKLDQYRPRNMRHEEFIISPDLEYTAGPFSTFNPNLAQLIRQNTPSSKIESYAIALSHNLEPVAREYADAMTEVLTQNPGVHTAMLDLGMNVPRDIYMQYLQKVLNKLADALHMGDIHLPPVFVIDSWDQIPAQLHPKDQDPSAIDGAHIHLTTQDGNSFFAIIIHRGNIARHSNNDKRRFFILLMNTLAHEFSHHIDKTCPNRGAIGAQQAALINSCPDITEYSAHTIGDSVEKRLNALFQR